MLGALESLIPSAECLCNACRASGTRHDSIYKELEREQISFSLFEETFQKEICLKTLHTCRKNRSGYRLDNCEAGTGISHFDENFARKDFILVCFSAPLEWRGHARSDENRVESKRGFVSLERIEGNDGNFFRYFYR